MSNKENFNMNDIEDIASTWKTKDVNWDKIHRMRFANADQEITPPEDSFTEKLKKK